MLLDGKYPLEGLDSALGSAISGVVDPFAWVVPAVFLSVLLIAFLVFIGSLLGDFPLEFDLPECFCGIFKSARASWGDERGESESAD
jgi:hypothetical protein